MRFTLKHLVVLVFLSLLTSASVLGQTVSISATQPTANEAGLVPGEFTISATGGPILGTGSVTVFLNVALGSTATSNVDYTQLPAFVNVPFGFGGNGSLDLQQKSGQLDKSHAATF